MGKRAETLLEKRGLRLTEARALRLGPSYLSSHRRYHQSKL
jgi:hypothetical protein